MLICFTAGSSYVKELEGVLSKRPEMTEMETNTITAQINTIVIDTRMF